MRAFFMLCTSPFLLTVLSKTNISPMLLRIFYLICISFLIFIAGKFLDRRELLRAYPPHVLQSKWGRILRVPLVSAISSFITQIPDDALLTVFTRPERPTLSMLVVVFSVSDCILIALACFFAFQDMSKREIAISASIVCIYYAIVFSLTRVIYIPAVLQHLLARPDAYNTANKIRDALTIPVGVYDTIDWVLFRYNEAPVYIRFLCVFIPLIFPVCARSGIKIGK